MQRHNIISYWQKLIPNLFILLGAGLITIALAADIFRGGGLSGFGANQFSLAFSGFAVFMTGIVLIASASWRRVGEWLLVGAGAVAVALAADLLVIGGLPGLGAKQIMLATVAFGLLLTSVVPASATGRQYVSEWLNLFTLEKEKIAKFLSIVVQLGLLVLVIRQFQLENQAFYHNLMLLTFYGFLIHFFLPARYRLPFFLFLSWVAIFGVLGLANGIWLIAIGLGLIGICHLPISFLARVVILLISGGILAVLRADLLQTPIPVAIWPILGSIFMFRLIIYLYDLNHQKESPNFWRSLSYFFLLPNVVFLLFPPVDYSTFRRTYYDEDQYQIYQTGIKWMFWGVMHLIFYRFVNYYLAIAPEAVANVGDLVRYVVSTLLLLVRVIGQFHLIVGLLHLFGFNLPRANHLIFMASSFTDFWRRANIYWKDFMLKVFYYPTYFRLRTLGTTTRLVLATVFAFVVTWFLHMYQWFWLRNSILLSGPDILFWTFFGILVLVNTLYETKRGRKRTLSKQAWSFRATALRSLGVIGTFTTIAILWSLWTSISVSEWISLWSVVAQPLDSIANLYPLFLVIGVLVGGTFWYSLGDDSEPGARPKQPAFFQTAATTGGALLFIFLLGSPFVYSRLGEKPGAMIADLKTSRLTDRDASLLLRGYYEGLSGINQFNPELWEIYSKKPSDWPLIQDTKLARMTDDFRIMELLPSQSEVFHGAQFTTNRWAMRDQEYEQTPAPGTYRIALVGPSFVMGSGVTDEEVFEAVLENRLNEENSGAVYNRFEILNFGMAGYSALQELYVLEDKALSFQPDMIFFVAHPLEEEKIVQNLANRLISGSEIPYDYLQDLIQQAGANPDMTQVEAERLLKPYGEQMISWTYSRVVKLSQERGITPIWIFMPTLETALSPEEIARLTRLAEEAGFIIVSLADLYENQNVDTLAVAEWDLHPNAKGHKLIADRLYDLLREKEGELPSGIFSQPESP